MTTCHAIEKRAIVPVWRSYTPLEIRIPIDERDTRFQQAGSGIDSVDEEIRSVPVRRRVSVLPRCVQSHRSVSFSRSIEIEMFAVARSKWTTVVEQV